MLSLLRHAEHVPAPGHSARGLTGRHARGYYEGAVGGYGAQNKPEPAAAWPTTAAQQDSSSVDTWTNSETLGPAGATVDSEWAGSQTAQTGADSLVETGWTDGETLAAPYGSPSASIYSGGSGAGSGQGNAAFDQCIAQCQVKFPCEYWLSLRYSEGTDWN